MNDQLSNKVIEWVESLTIMAGKEIPEFVQEVAAYGIVKSVMGVVLSVIGLVLIGWLSWVVFAKWELANLTKPEINPVYWDNPYSNFMFLSPAVGFVALFLCAACVTYVEGGLKAYYSPKLYFLEQFQKK